MQNPFRYFNSSPASVPDRFLGSHPKDFKADMLTLFDLLRDRAIHPVVIDRLPLWAAREVHTRIDLGGLGGRSCCYRARGVTFASGT